MVQNYVQKKAREQATWSLLLLLLFPVNLEGVSMGSVDRGKSFIVCPFNRAREAHLINIGNRP